MVLNQHSGQEFGSHGKHYVGLERVLLNKERRVMMEFQIGALYIWRTKGYIDWTCWIVVL